MSWVPTDALEHEGSPAFGLYIALLMEATAVALAILGWRLGGLLMIWAGQ